MENGYSLSDIAALMGNRRNDDGFLEGNGIVILLLFFLMIGRWGNNGGWGGNGNNMMTPAESGALTRAELQQGFDTNNVLRKLDGLANGLCDGFYAQNTTLLNGFATLGQEINNNRFAAQQCCCETNRNIDSVKAENYKNTCEITTAIHAEGEATRALINQNTMDALRGKLAETNQMLQTANFQLSQQSQNATLINALRPFPQPAYITCSPYQSNAGNGYGWGGCGCGF